MEFESPRLLNQPLELRVTGLRLPARRYEDDGDLSTTLAGAPVETLSWQLVPG
jgi:hypothetical protein